MKSFAASLALLATTVAAAAVPTTRSTSKNFYLKTEVIAGKESLGDLYVQHYHTAAGFNDATFTGKTKVLPEFYLTPTNETLANGEVNNLLQTDLGTPYTFVQAQDTVFYTAWSPVRINAGNGSTTTSSTSAFYINDDGLQWYNNPGAENGYFGGWLVCDWWHQVPQLFFVNYDYNVTLLSSCASVKLIPEYC